jgi:hypothetical protein
MTARPGLVSSDPTNLRLVREPIYLEGTIVAWVEPDVEREVETGDGD